MPFLFNKIAGKNIISSVVKLKSIYFVILISIVFYACRKNNYEPSVSKADTKMQLVQKLQQEFNRKAYAKNDLNLEEVLKINTKLVWEIHWTSEKIIPDTVNSIIYVYIPLEPHIESGQKVLSIKNINYNRYLLATIM